MLLRNGKILNNMQQPTQRQPRCCSFCRKPGHFKPRCEKYKIFAEIINLPDHARILSDIQRAFMQYMGNRSFADSSDLEFQVVLLIFLQEFMGVIPEEPLLTATPVPASAPAPAPKPKNQTQRIKIELCDKNTTKTRECGICLTDEIRADKMVKFGCEHEYCGDCAKKILYSKPCCAFCRKDVQLVQVHSRPVYEKFL